MRGVFYVAAVALVSLAGCGGGDSGSDSATAASVATVPTVSHAAASVALTEQNAPYIAANVGAVRHSVFEWIAAVFYYANHVLPGTPTYGFNCSNGPFAVRYLDNDRDGKETAGDQISIDSASACPMAVAGGTTLLTTLAAGPSGAIDARVQANNTLDAFTLEASGWRQRMQGSWRVTLSTDGVTVNFYTEGDVQLTLGNGDKAILRNAALTWNPTTQVIGGQLDMFFNGGSQQGTQVQVDLFGYLRRFAAYVGLETGYVQISGASGTKAQIRDVFVDNVGSSVELRLDDLGTGQYSKVTTQLEAAFYSAATQ